MTTMNPTSRISRESREQGTIARIGGYQPARVSMEERAANLGSTLGTVALLMVLVALGALYLRSLGVLVIAGF